MLEKSISNRPLAANRIADGVGVQHVARHQSNGFRRSVIFSCVGRGMLPDQEPRQDRNSSDHSSAGSRITRRPSRCTRTSC